MKEILLLFFMDGVSGMFLGSWMECQECFSGAGQCWFCFGLLTFCSRADEILWVTKRRCSWCFLYWLFNKVPPSEADLEMSQNVWSGIWLWFPSCGGANWRQLFFKGKKTKQTNHKPQNLLPVFLFTHTSEWVTHLDATTLMQDFFVILGYRNTYSG